MSSARSPLIGREAELTHAAAWLDEASQGRGGVLLLSGEPGIGKTALASAIAAEAMARGFTVSVGRALEMSSAPPWLPLRPCLRAIGIARGLLPSVEHEVYGLWEEVLAALSDAALRAPTLWVIEDLHAADLQTLDLLLFLAHPLRALKVAVLLSARAVDALSSDAVTDRLVRLGRAGEVLELVALDEAATRALVHKAAGRPLSDARIAELVAHSKGHPLFALELARAAGSHLPPTILHVVQARLAALPIATRGVLENAAVLGREVTAATLGRLLGRLPAAVIDDLLPAVRARLLEELAPGRFQFSHALVRDAIHAALPPARRCAAHAAVERVLAERGESRDALVLRADHALQAQDAIDAARVDDVVRRAVQSLGDEGAHDRAFALLRRWLETRVTQPDAGIVLEAARLASAAGLHAESTRLSQEVIERGRAAGDSALVGEGVLVLGATLRPGFVQRQLARALEDALARLEADATSDAGLRCRVRARLAAALQPAADTSVPVGMARAAIAEARTLGDPKLLREVLLVASSALIDCVDPDEAHALAVELSERARSAGDDALRLRAEVRRIVHALQLGELEPLGTDVDRLLRLAEGVGHPVHVWRAFLMASMRALARGDFAESARYFGEVEELARMTDDPALALGREAHGAVRAIASDDPDALRAVRGAYERILPSEVGASTRAMLLAQLAVRLEDRAEAAFHLKELTSDHQLMARLRDSDLFLLFVVCEAAALTGAREVLERLAPLLERGRARMVFSGQVDFMFCGPLERVLGLAQAALGELERAELSLRSARERCSQHALRPWTARLDLELARVYAARGKHDAARASAQAALAVAEALPMRATAARARSLLESLHGGVSTSAPSERALSAAPVELKHEGELWRARYAGRDVFVKDSRGMQLLARLVAAPGARVHVLALASDEGGALAESHGGSALDAAALRHYRVRLGELDDAITEAEGMEDGSRAEQLLAERDAITAELKRAVGLGGRLRKVGSLTERARVNVTRRLRDAIARITEVHPELGRHLSDAVRTGTHCDYRP